MPGLHVLAPIETHDAQAAERDHKSARSRNACPREQRPADSLDQITRPNGWLRCGPRGDPDRLRSRLIPTGRLENRHAPGGLATPPARLCLNLRTSADLLCSGPLRGTAPAFTLTHQYPPCPRPTSWQTALIGPAPARNSERVRCGSSTGTACVHGFSSAFMHFDFMHLERSSPPVNPFRASGTARKAHRTPFEHPFDWVRSQHHSVTDRHLILLQFWWAHKDPAD
jgi:hypothetical protein